MYIKKTTIPSQFTQCGCILKYPQIKGYSVHVNLTVIVSFQSNVLEYRTRIMSLPKCLCTVDKFTMRYMLTPNIF